MVNFNTNKWPPPFRPSPPSPPDPKKVEWETTKYRIRDLIGFKTLYWIEKSEPKCLDLLICSQSLIGEFKDKQPLKIWKRLFLPVFLQYEKYKEWSFIITPAAKAYEGILIRIMIEKGEIDERELNSKRVSIGRLYQDSYKGKKRIEAPAKKYLLRKVDKNGVNKLYTDWDFSRNKVLHFDKNFLVEDFEEAKSIVEAIYGSIRLAYKIFIGEPD